jgi:hypothetical protein
VSIQQKGASTVGKSGTQKKPAGFFTHGSDRRGQGEAASIEGEIDEEKRDVRALVKRKKKREAVAKRSKTQRRGVLYDVCSEAPGSHAPTNSTAFCAASTEHSNKH